MKTFKKFTAFLLTFVMLLGLMPILDLSSIDLPTVSLKSEAATGDELWSGNYKIEVLDEAKKTCSITDYTGTDTDLVIPSVLNGYTVTEIGNYAFLGCSALSSVTIPDSVKTIGTSAFRGCSALTSVTIPDSCITIGEYAFAMTDSWEEHISNSLKTVIIGNSVEDIGNSAFEGTAYYNNEANWENGVLYIGKYLIKANDTLSGAYKIKEGTRVIADDAFNGCSSLTSVTIPDSCITIGDEAFEAYYNYNTLQYESSLTSVTIGNSVETIGYGAFYGCAFTSITIPDSVKTIGNSVFNGCKALTSVAIGNSVETIGNSAFGDCYKLSSVTIPDSVSKIEDKAFACCFRLDKIFLPDSVKTIGDSVFYRCTSLTDITVDKANPNYCDLDGVLFNKAKTTLVMYPIGNKRGSYLIPNSVETISNSVFKGCRRLTSIVIPDSCITIENSAFYECKNLTSITIGNSVETIGNSAFGDCYKLTSIVIPDSVITIGDYAFCDCSALTSVTIGNAAKTIGGGAFSDCSALTSVTLGNSIETIGYEAFYNCSVLTSIAIPNSVISIENAAFDGTAYYNDEASWENGILYNGKYLLAAKESFSGAYTVKDGTRVIAEGAFSDCSALTSLIIPDSVEIIGDVAFIYCYGLTSVTIGNSVRTIGSQVFCNCSALSSVTLGKSVEAIGAGAFMYCTALTSITVDKANPNYCDLDGVLFNKAKTTLVLYPIGNKPDSYTIPNSVKTIGDSAFEYCTALTSITIPDSCITIGAGAFMYCTALTSVTIGNSVETIGGLAFSFCSDLKSVTIGNSVKTIGEGAFEYCTALTSVTLPDSVKTIGNSAFSGCSALTRVTLGNSVKTIGERAFYGCTAITSIIIGNSLEAIGDRDFNDCSDLSGIRISSSVKAIDKKAFYKAKYLIITGVKGSYAETFAKENHILFMEANPIISFNPVKGTGEPKATEVPYNTVFTVPEDIPQREGGTFLGWTDVKGSKEVKYRGGDTFTVTEDKVLYAVWDLTKYTVTFNGNGGTLSQKTLTKEHGNDLTISNVIPVREGYTFLGWAETQAAITPAYRPDETFTKNEATVLYAVWRINRHTLYYGLNKGEGSFEPITADYGTVLQISAKIPTRTEGTFLGWATEKGSKVVTYQPSDKIPLTEDTTLYAVWDMKQYTLSYKLNGGEGVFEAVTADYGTILQLSANIPTRTEGTFLGWATEKGSKVVTYQPEDIITLTENTTLYAVWDMNQYTLYYDLDKGEGLFNPVTADYGTVLKISSEKPTREEGTFLGWATEKGSKVVTYKPSDEITLTGATTLYAVWDLKKYTVMFNGNGGTGVPENQTKEHGNDLTISDVLPVREGYTFLGWATDKKATVPDYSAGAVFTTNKNTLLYALWEINQYALSYDLNGGSGSFENITADYGTVITLPSEKPVKDRLPFLGWSTDKNAETATYQPSDKITLTKDLTLYAVWKIEKYTLSYDLTYGEGSFAPVTAEYKTELQISSTIPTRTEGTFLGWSTEKGSKTVVYQPSDKITLTENIILYAVWDMNTYFVTYDANGGDVTPDTVLVEYGTPTPLTSVKPSKQGLYFLGWSEDKNATEPTYLPGGLFIAKGNVTLYAIYGDKPLLEDGDIDGDGKVTLNDAMLIINDVAKKTPLSDDFKSRADIDEDGKITLNDAMYIISFVAKKSDSVKPKN